MYLPCQAVATIAIVAGPPSKQADPHFSPPTLKSDVLTGPPCRGCHQSSHLRTTREYCQFRHFMGVVCVAPLSLCSHPQVDEAELQVAASSGEEVDNRARAKVLMQQEQLIKEEEAEEKTVYEEKVVSRVH